MFSLGHELDRDEEDDSGYGPKLYDLRDTTFDGSETWETSVKPPSKNIFLEDFNHFNGDTMKSSAHTEAMLAFTKRLMGKYIILQRTVSLIFTMMHIS